jgi:hypothetical protein
LWLHLSNPEPVKKTPCPHEHVALREDDDSVPGRPYCTDCGDDVPRIPMLTTDYLIAITEPPPRQGLLGPIRDRARVVEVEALDKPEANNLEHVLEQVSVPHGSKVYIVPLDLCETYERPTAAKIERRS